MEPPEIPTNETYGIVGIKLVIGLDALETSLDPAPELQGLTGVPRDIMKRILALRKKVMAITNPSGAPPGGGGAPPGGGGAPPGVGGTPSTIDIPGINNRLTSVKDNLRKIGVSV
jgi:hypothetical protein